MLGPTTKKRQTKHLKDKTKKPAKPAEQDMLLDLISGDAEPAPSPTTGGSQNTADLLADILGGGGGESPAPQPAQQPSAATNTSAIMDLFGSNGNTPSPAEPASASMDLVGGGIGSTASPGPTGAPVHAAFNKNDLNLTLQVQRSNNGNAQIQGRFRNDSNFNHFSSVGLQAAVPKTQRLQLNAINKAELDAGEEGVQTMKVAALNGVSPIRPFSVFSLGMIAC